MPPLRAVQGTMKGDFMVLEVETKAISTPSYNCLPT